MKILAVLLITVVGGGLATTSSPPSPPELDQLIDNLFNTTIDSKILDSIKSYVSKNSGGEVNALLREGLKMLSSSPDTSSLLALWNDLRNKIPSEVWAGIESILASPTSPSASSSSSFVLFRPLIAKILKENQIPLEIDAVMTTIEKTTKAFLKTRKEEEEGRQEEVGRLAGRQEEVGRLGGERTEEVKQESVKKGKENGNLDIASMMSMAASLMGNGNKNNGKNGNGPDLSAMLNMATQFMGNGNKKNGNKNGDLDIASMLSMATQLMGNKKNGNKNGDFDIGSMLSMASQFMGNGNQKNGKNGNAPDLSSMLNMATKLMGNGKNNGNKNGDLDIGSMLTMASAFMGDGNKKNGNNGNEPDLSAMLNMATQFMGDGNKKNGKNGNGPDLSAMLNMATQFLGDGNKKNGKNGNGPDLSSMLTMATQLMGNGKKNGDLDLGSMLNMATKLMGNGKPNPRQPESTKPNPREPESTKPASPKPESTKPESSKPESSKPESTKPEPPKPASSPKKTQTLLGLLEPFLLSLKTEPGCNARLRQYMDRARNLVGTQGTRGTQMLIGPLKAFAANYIPKEELEALITSLKKALQDADWSELMTSLAEPDHREKFVTSLTPRVTSLVELVARDDTQASLLSAIGARISATLASYGVTGVTLDNFPQRLAPIVGLMAPRVAPRMTIKPAAMLEGVQAWVKETLAWVRQGLAHTTTLNNDQLQQLVFNSLYHDVIGTAVAARDAVASSPPSKMAVCVPQRVCGLVAARTGLAAAVARISGLAFGAESVLGTNDADLTYRLFTAVTYTQDCLASFPGECNVQPGDDSKSFKHMEL